MFERFANAINWLSAALADSESIQPGILVARLVAAVLLGVAVAGIYRGTRTAWAGRAAFEATLVLLAITIGVATQVIGSNSARAFSLVGALSIVRFRTVVRDTKDTAFVILAVVLGMAAGAGQGIEAVLGLAAAGVTAAVFRDASPRSLLAAEMLRLTVRLGLADEMEAGLHAALARLADDVQPASVATVRHGSALALDFRLRLRPGISPRQLVSELNRLEGVQEVELGREAE